MWNSSVPREGKSVSLALLLLLGMFLSIVPRANAADTGIWVINPSTGAPPTGNGNFTFYADQTTPVGTRFNVTVWVSSVADLFAWQIRLYYFPKLLNFTGATYPEGHVFAGKGIIRVEPATATRAFKNESTINMMNPTNSVWLVPPDRYIITDWFDVDKSGDLSTTDIVWLEKTGETAQYFRVESLNWELDATDPDYGMIVEYPYIEFGCSLSSPGQEFSGTGKLAAFEFELQVAPQKLATLSSVLGINNTATFLEDPEGEISPVSKHDGSLLYVWSMPSKPNVAVRRSDGEAWPLEFGSTPQPTGKAFDVNLAIENLDAEWGLIEANMTIAFNATVIDIVGGLGNITILSDWSPTKLEINYNAYPQLDNLTIHVRPSSMSTPSGNVLVATVKLTVVYAGPWGVDIISPLNFVESVLVDDPGPALIPQNPPVNGTVIIKGLTIEVRFPGSPKRNEYIASKNGTFDVEVWLNDVTADKRLASAQFRLKYNSTLLRVLNIAEGTFLKSFPNIAPPNDPTYFVAYDEPDGLYGPHVLVGILLFPSESEPSYYNFPNGSGPLARITFEGIYRGSYPEKNNCSLQLVEVVLLNDKYPFDDSITASPIDGYYEIVSYATPVAAFTARSSISGALHLNVTVPVVFDASDSTHPLNLPIVSYTWNFGDGNETITALKATSHVFAIPGDYIVDLTVTDDDGKTMTTTKSIAVWKLSSTISMDISSPSATFGQTMTVDGTVAREVSSLSASVDINLFCRLQGEENWQAMATIPTDADGHYSYTWEPKKSTLDMVDVFELNASWAGDSITSSAQNGTAFELKMAKSIITVNVNPFSLVVGSKATLNGVITPHREGVNVTILYRTMGGIWMPYATVNTDSQGNFENTWEVQGVGIFEARAVYAGDQNAGPAQSSIVALTVTKSLTIMKVNVYPSKAIAGSSISVYGGIEPKKQSINVTISYRKLDGLWKTLAVVMTDSDGRYSAVRAIDEIGTFQIKASWEGDSSSLPSEDIETITVEAQPMNILLYILIAILVITITVAMMVYYRRRKKHELNTAA